MTEYWAFIERLSQPRDIGHMCKECGKPFLRPNEDICIRRGGRIELRYHKHCFSGTADPRSQSNSSFNSSHKLPAAAPLGRYRKMRTGSQF